MKEWPSSNTVNQFYFILLLVTAADECTDGVDSCDIKVNPVGMNKDGDLCYGKYWNCHSNSIAARVAAYSTLIESESWRLPKSLTKIVPTWKPCRHSFILKTTSNSKM